MSNHIIILGAGASVSAGAPLMIDFLDKAKMCYAAKQVKSRTAFENVFSAIGKLQLAHSKAQLDIVNMESVFNALEMARLAGGFSEYTDDNINSVIKDFQTLILETLEASIKFPANRGQVGATTDYKRLAELLYDHKNKNDLMHDISFISFNYDIAVDHALQIYGHNPHYYLYSPSSRNTPLLKLHGSCNWTTRHDTGDIIALDLKDYWNKYSYQGMGPSDISIEISKHTADYFNKNTDVKVSGDIVVVPPSWNKTSYGGGLKKVWVEAKRRLSMADHIHIVGYSFPQTDMYFGLLYAIGTISERPLSSLNIYNPDNSDYYKEKARSIFGPGALARLKFYPYKFSDAVAEIMNKINQIV